jgi:2-methylisocitrate lyase-like PEP mutase family enzyme
MSEQRKRFRKLLEGRSIIVAPGAFDALSARLVEEAGFPAVYVTGGGLSRSWGFPDIGLMTMMENVGLIGRVCESVKIPVIADADTGYGSVLNVIRTVKEYERIGVACFHLEDQVTPKRCGHYDGKKVIGREEMKGKIKAAVDTRRGRNLESMRRLSAGIAMRKQERKLSLWRHLRVLRRWSGLPKRFRYRF